MDALVVSALEFDSVSTESFGDLHFGTCDFGDKRLTHRAVTTATALMRHPGGTLPSKLSRAQLCGFYDFANNAKVNPENVLAGHYRQTRARMAACEGPVLIIHDTTEGDYSGLDIPDLGPIGGVGHHRGLLIHNVLAMDYSTHSALGLVGQIARVRRSVPRRESVKASREHPLRESRLWTHGVNIVSSPPVGAMWVNLMDRGGDTFESLDLQQSLGQFYLVRSSKNRNVRVTDAAGRKVQRKLHDWARRLPTLCMRTVAVEANANQTARNAVVRIAAGPVQLQVPKVKYGQHGRTPLDAWVIHLKELDPPKGQAPLEWFLLTNVSTKTKTEAAQRVDWYNCRPMIEELHKAQKTGCGMEQIQFTTRRALEVTIAMLSVVAVQLLRLRDLSRQSKDHPATEVIDEPYIETLCLWRWKQTRANLTAKEFLFALARLGGHLGRSGDHPPGWLVLWRGWMELQRLVEGLLLARIKRSG
jgi:transposase-like protein